MLRSLNEMKGYSLRALDGQIGKCRDFLLDDKSWVLRYMVADTGGWLSGREVLISPNSIGKPDWASHSIPVKLTKAQIENAPSLAKSEPVSRIYEVEYYRYFNWPYYWVGSVGDISVGHPVFPPSELEDETGLLPEDSAEKSSHIRSGKELIGYHIQATDREIGHLEDFIVQEEGWYIRYIVIDTRNWLPGKKVIVSTGWFHNVSWLKKKVFVEMTADAIKRCPEFNPHEPVNRKYEVKLYDYYGRPKYWDSLK